MNAEQKERVAGSMVRLMMDTGKLKVSAYVNNLKKQFRGLSDRSDGIGSKTAWRRTRSVTVSRELDWIKIDRVIPQACLSQLLERVFESSCQGCH